MILKNNATYRILRHLVASNKPPNQSCRNSNILERGWNCSLELIGALGGLGTFISRQPYPLILGLAGDGKEVTP